jgi:hypothetical protein
LRFIVIELVFFIDKIIVLTHHGLEVESVEDPMRIEWADSQTSS